MPLSAEDVNRLTSPVSGTGYDRWLREAFRGWAAERDIDAENLQACFDAWVAGYEKGIEVAY